MGMWKGYYKAMVEIEIDRSVWEHLCRLAPILTEAHVHAPRDIASPRIYDERKIYRSFFLGFGTRVPRTSLFCLEAYLGSIV